MKIKSTILSSSLLASTMYANPTPPKIGDVLKQLNIDKNDLDEDCQGCLGSEVTECK